MDDASIGNLPYLIEYDSKSQPKPKLQKHQQRDIKHASFPFHSILSFVLTGAVQLDNSGLSLIKIMVKCRLNHQLNQTH